MMIFEIRGPGAHERANCSLAGCVNAKGRSAFYARDRALENDGAAVIQKRKPFCTVDNAAFTLMLNSLSKCSSETLGKGTNSPTPTLAKIVSIRPLDRKSVV